MDDAALSQWFIFEWTGIYSSLLGLGGYHSACISVVNQVILGISRLIHALVLLSGLLLIDHENLIFQTIRRWGVVLVDQRITLRLQVWYHVTLLVIVNLCCYSLICQAFIHTVQIWHWLHALASVKLLLWCICIFQANSPVDLGIFSYSSWFLSGIVALRHKLQVWLR